MIPGANLEEINSPTEPIAISRHASDIWQRARNVMLVINRTSTIFTRSPSPAGERFLCSRFSASRVSVYVVTTKVARKRGARKEKTRERKKKKRVGQRGKSFSTRSSRISARQFRAALCLRLHPTRYTC